MIQIGATASRVSRSIIKCYVYWLSPVDILCCETSKMISLSKLFCVMCMIASRRLLFSFYGRIDVNGMSSSLFSKA